MREYFCDGFIDFMLKSKGLLEFTKIDEIRNYLIEEINRNELMSKKHKVCRVFNYIDH